jgi:hypothetical protein
MRDRQMMYVFVALNLGLAAACLSFIVLNHDQPQSVPRRADVGQPTPAVMTCKAPTVEVAKVEHSAALPGSVVRPSEKTFDWHDVWSPAYPHYIERLRAAGCPAENAARLVIKDVDDFYAQQRIEAALAHDQEWWRADAAPATLGALQMFGRALVQQRADLLNRLLGPATAPGWRSDIEFWRVVPLTGSVLGLLTPEVHEHVQEIWARGQERLAATSNALAAAKIEGDMRRQLTTVLTAEQLQEFLLRYSSTSQRLRVELSGLSPSPEEFRRIFAAIAPLDEQMAMEYGDVARLSAKQRERHLQLRAEAIQAVLPPARFDAYIASLRIAPGG